MLVLTVILELRQRYPAEYTEYYIEVSELRHSKLRLEGWRPRQGQEYFLSKPYVTSTSPIYNAILQC